MYLKTLLMWMAETVYTGDFENEWYYDMLNADGTVQGLLTDVGQALIELFG